MKFAVVSLPVFRSRIRIDGKNYSLGDVVKDVSEGVLQLLIMRRFLKPFGEKFYFIVSKEIPGKYEKKFSACDIVNEIFLEDIEGLVREGKIIEVPDPERNKGRVQAPELLFDRTELFN